MHATWGERGEVTNQKGNYASIPLASNIVHRVTSKCSNSIWISVMVDWKSIFDVPQRYIEKVKYQWITRT